MGIVLVARASGGTVGRGGTVTIFSDSQTANRAIRARRITSGLVLEWCDELKQLCKLHQINLVWVPGHSRMGGNEETDELVRRGTVIGEAGACCGPSAPARKR